MNCIQQTVFIFSLFTNWYINGCGASPDERYKSNNVSCSNLHKIWLSANEIVLNDESFRDELIRKDIIIHSDDPGYKFFNIRTLSEKQVTTYHDSSISFEASQMFAEHFFGNKPPRSQNINPLLRKHSHCVEEQFLRFCVANNRCKCDKNQKYRRLDGRCTNLDRPIDGAANTQFVSFLYQNYDDSISKMRTQARNGKRLPLPRTLSNIFFGKCKNRDVFLEDGPSVAAILFGAVLVVDSSAAAYPQSYPALACCKKDLSRKLPKELQHKNCDPITIPRDDSFFGHRGIRCMNFHRAQNAYDNDCVLSSRKQMNVVTSFQDLSHIYGTSEEASSNIRSFKNGLLKMNKANHFPEDAAGRFVLNDHRIFISPVLAVFQLLFMRQHNRIASTIKRLYPEWNDELVFQEARRWNIAQYQHIMLQWIKIFIPAEYRDLRITKDNNVKVTAATANEFGQSVFRFHHMFVPETIQLFNCHQKMVQEIYLTDADTPALIRNSYSNLVRSLFHQKQNYNGCHNQIRNHLYKGTNGIGIDTFAFDIKRGRDAGIQPFHKYIELCLNIEIKSFSDLKCVMSDKIIRKLRQVYDSVVDIDLFIGVALENKPNREYQFGQIGACIVNEQIHRYHHGDSFFYDNPNQNHPFSDAQLAEIHKASMSRMLCDNGDVKEVPKNAFIAISDRNPIVDCKSVRSVNIVY